MSARIRVRSTLAGLRPLRARRIGAAVDDQFEAAREPLRAVVYTGLIGVVAIAVAVVGIVVVW